MLSDKIENMAVKLKRSGIMHFPEAASTDQIIDFEKTNGVHLPLQYKAWLMYADGGTLFLPGDIQLYGVAHKPIIDVNDDDRPSED